MKYVESYKPKNVKFNLNEILSTMVKIGLIFSIGVYSIACLAFIARCFSLN